MFERELKKFKDVYILRRSTYDDFSVLDKFNYIDDDEDTDYMYVCQGPVYKVKKSDFIHSREEAMYQVMKLRLETGFQLSTKQKNETKIVKRLQTECPELFM